MWYNKIMKPQVLEAIEKAFHPQTTEEHLQEKNGRVFGTVTVIGSPTFDELDDIRRQMRLWEQLSILLGYKATSVGPVVLQPTQRGMKRG